LTVRTEWREQKLLFQAHGSRAVAAAFDGGQITSDGGALLLRELESKQQIVRDFAACFIGSLGIAVQASHIL
jgi:hypothetical protein